MAALRRFNCRASSRTGFFCIGNHRKTTAHYKLPESSRRRQSTLLSSALFLLWCAEIYLWLRIEFIRENDKLFIHLLWVFIQCGVGMIVRTWHGCVPLQHRKGFAAHLNATGVQHAKATAGNCGAFVREEVQGEYAHFFLATYWASLPAIKNFAGKQYQVAVTYPEDEAFGLISDPYVFHHWVDEVTTL